MSTALALLPYILGFVFAVWFPYALVASARKAGDPGGARDRRSLVDSFATAVTGVVLAWVFTPWYDVPPILFAVPVALTVLGTILAVRAWPDLPWVSVRRGRPLAVLGTVLGVAFAAGVVWLVLP